jgi:methionyl-tRNA formyltransferase
LGASCSIIFLGTPDFAVASLDALVQAGMDVVAVVTAPDKPAGRGMKLTPSAVKQYALDKNIPVLQPEKLRDPLFLSELRSYQADVQVVVAFRMLPEMVWSMPPLGTINLHGSLLPQYRGAAPINWAIMNGELETGVTTFKLKQEIDTGDVLQKKSMPIGPEDDFRTVHDRMKTLGADLLVETVRGVCNGTLEAMPQSSVQTTSLKKAPKIFTTDCAISWERPTWDIHNQVRGLSPFPGAFTELHGKTLKVYRTKPFELPPSAEAIKPGQVYSDGKSMLAFRTGNGWLAVLELQLEGKKRMGTADFLRGYHWPDKENEHPA